MIRFSSRNVGTTQSVLAMLAFNFILLVSLAARANAAPSCPDYVTSLYNDLLHRAPYASEMAVGGGWQDWTAACNAYEQGQPDGQTREQILIGFMNSAECQAMPSCVGGAQQMLNNGVTVLPPPPGFGSSFGWSGGMVYVTGAKDPKHSYRVLDLVSVEQCRDVLNGITAFTVTPFQWTRALACNKEATAVGNPGHGGPTHQGLGPVIDPFNRAEPHRGDTIVPGPGIGR